MAVTRQDQRDADLIHVALVLSRAAQRAMKKGDGEKAIELLRDAARWLERVGGPPAKEAVE